MKIPEDINGGRDREGVGREWKNTQSSVQGEDIETDSF